MTNTTNDHGWLFTQLFSNWKKFEIIYVTILLLLQVCVYLIAPDSWIGMLSGVFGTIALVYGMKGRKVTFIFGFIQCVAMTYIAWQSHTWGTFVMDIFYVISQPIGWFMWGHDDATKRFSPQARRWVFVGVVIAYFIGWYVIGLFHGQLPYFDSFNLVVSFIAQLLYILKYQENWSLWIWVNTANIIYWIILAIRFQMGVHIGTFGGDLSQIALQAALLFNSIYATKVWASGEADNEGGTTD
ncbi:nicotinamide riboside transporter PnuC [Limosilactobacillus agrestis]|uniref:Nicotinamide mononucleotide transporter n=1 Tax=Limosilactobacillus agrestis TaxID=2759748 RepID=A0A7W3UH58_9LACO|nr:nicotinamide riboside transporter PnuC [Limosilactobacillus agrestis]MBB1095364.1 nicotinamide mononucleotide transporter [Limosilactobacillus agrestis]MBB1098659.1 nicotinamide mononucleotide transporter [Limosilactobacillus agrestis]MCD7126017.1 nicotinamide riboside transporter PnuC [Limosilactobacillus agrestis]MCD7130302.1 nicotinamide riboside transporter PnuC [Limosilactobacillus agrestis]